MHTYNTSRRHGCALDRAVTGQVDGSVHDTIGGVLNLSIFNDNETDMYGSCSEPVNGLSRDTKTIPTPKTRILVILHVVMAAPWTGQLLDKLTVLFMAELMVLWTIPSNETYEPVNNVLCDTNTIQTPSAMQTGNSSQSTPCPSEASSHIFQFSPKKVHLWY